MGFRGDPVRLLVIPGLNDSGPAHWQTWLQAHFKRQAVRVQQEDFGQPDLAAWAGRIEATVVAHPRTHWVAAAHSFGCLALLRYLGQGGAAVRSALLVAPADPQKFGVVDRLPRSSLPIASVLIASETDPWMSITAAREWGTTWGSRVLNLGDVGHINADSGFGPLPQAKSLVRQMIQRAERERRLDRAHPLELSFAI